MLSNTQERGNEKIMSDRVILKNYSGRETSFLGIITCCYELAEDKQGDIFIIYRCLTNFHMFEHVLRDEDNKNYTQWRMAASVLGKKELKIEISQKHAIFPNTQLEKSDTIIRLKWKAKATQSVCGGWLTLQKKLFLYLSFKEMKQVEHSSNTAAMSSEKQWYCNGTVFK